MFRVLSLRSVQCNHRVRPIAPEVNQLSGFEPDALTSANETPSICAYRPPMIASNAAYVYHIHLSESHPTSLTEYDDYCPYSNSSVLIAFLSQGFAAGFRTVTSFLYRSSPRLHNWLCDYDVLAAFLPIVL